MTIEESLAAKHIDRLLRLGYPLATAEAGAVRVLCSQGFGLQHSLATAKKIAALFA